MTAARQAAVCVVVFLLGGYSPASAQPAPSGFEKGERTVPHHRLPPMNLASSYDGPQPFDVLHYKLDISLALVTSALQGKSTITMRLKSAVDSLVLHGVGLSLDTVTVDGVSKTVTFNTSVETFTVHLNGIRNMGDTLRIGIAYTRIQGYPRPNSRQGYYFFRDTIGIPSNLGYTFSEPSDARFWMPCYDEPWEKASAEINVTVPAGYVAASNGKLLGVTDNVGGTRTWRWKEDNQIATYLMCVTASQFTVSNSSYVRAIGDTVPLQYYAWAADSLSCALYLPTVRQMMGAFSGRFGEYPFDKYGMTAIAPFGYLGMEHQTITTLNRFARTWEKVVAHELAHQWWGDLVTCGTWPNIWLNESFATYSEALWFEHLGGLTGLKNYMKDTLEHFQFSSWQGAVYDPVGQGFNLFDDVVYSKGAWILHTLRGVLGDSTFFRALRAYRGRYSGRSAVTSEFAAVVDSIAGTDMSWFFNQWIYGRGWPIYAFASKWETDTLTLNILQTQSPPSPVYKMPIRVRATYPSGDTTFVVWDSLASQTFRLHSPFQPSLVEFDPDRWILKKTIPYPVSVKEGGVPIEFALHQNFPNPFNPTTMIAFTLPSLATNGARGREREGSFVNLKVYDVLGREVATLVNEIKSPGLHSVVFDGANLASGIYVYRLGAGAVTVSRKMILLK